MNTRIIQWTAAAIISSLIILVTGSELVSASQSVSLVDPDQATKILDATVQIRIYSSPSSADVAYEQAIKDTGGYVVTQGLGTLVLWQGTSVIVTHNHWGKVLSEAGIVEILDARGKRLCSMKMEEFNQRMLYNDPGTLIALAPIGVPAANETLSVQTTLSEGEMVIVARQASGDVDRVDLLQATVAGGEDYKNQAVYKLALLDGGVIDLGDSGGGIWVDGMLVGNMWAAYLSTISLPFSGETSLAAPLPSLDLQDGEEPEPGHQQNLSEILADYMIAE